MQRQNEVVHNHKSDYLFRIRKSTIEITTDAWSFSSEIFFEPFTRNREMLPDTNLDSPLYRKLTITPRNVGFLRWLKQQRICLQCRRPGFNPWVGKILRKRECQPTPVFLPGEFHGQRSLAGYSPWGHKE